MTTKSRVSLSCYNGSYQVKIYDSVHALHGAGVHVRPDGESGKFWLEKVRLTLKTEDSSYPYLVSLCASHTIFTFPSTQMSPLFPFKFSGEDQANGVVYSAPVDGTHKVLMTKYILSNGSPFQWVAPSRKDMIYFTPSDGLEHQLFIRVMFPASQRASLSSIADANEPRLALELYGEAS